MYRYKVFYHKNRTQFLRSSISDCLRVTFFVLIIFVIVTKISQAETHYVAPNGSAAWQQSISIDTPCAPTTAMNNAVAGDTVFFRGGMYELGASSGYGAVLEPLNSGVVDSPIVFKAYSGETPILNGAPEAAQDNVRVIGTNCKDYITIDGFTCTADSGVKMGGIILGGQCSPRSTGIILRNCIIDGGTTVNTSNDNRECLRIEKTSNVLVQNCLIYSAWNSYNNHNTSGVKTYQNDHLTLENCDISNCTQAIFFKRDDDDMTFRNNYIHDNYRGILISVYITSGIYSSERNKYYNNVFANNTINAFNVDQKNGQNTNDMQVYNNTFYNTRVGPSFGRGECKIWNNILQDTQYPIVTMEGNVLLECNHNQFGDSAKNYLVKLRQNDSTEAIHTNLESWQSSGELEGDGNPGVGSLGGDPMFVNLSGNMNQLADFALRGGSPCIGTGKGGVNLGADIEGVGIEMILFSSVIDGISPLAPTGLTVQ
ncbi:MAG: right-handed parallel beta-helix repeat-containing protein [Candidatus Brocadiaceae bacterium]|nr:right-handed parallel beta-helix repeat-containing protein [Candidatus Brocadiaceae bacterium]